MSLPREVEEQLIDEKKEKEIVQTDRIENRREEKKRKEKRRKEKRERDDVMQCYCRFLENLLMIITQLLLFYITYFLMLSFFN